MTSEVNGLTDISGRNDVVSLKITYAETPEDLAERDFKQIKFWMNKDDALGLGQFITESAQRRGENPSSPVN